MRQEFIQTIFEIASKPSAFDELEKLYVYLSREQIIQEITQIGIIPEAFAHDSSEEKLWSKLSDIFLSASLNHLGLSPRVMTTGHENEG